jgi:hypothetical protein
MSQHKFAVSLNDNDAEEAQWVNGIVDSGMIPAHLLKEALRYYFGTTRPETVTATTSDVVQAINEGFATMAKLLQNISVVQASIPQSAEYGTPELPPTMTDATVEWEEINPNDNTPFLQGVRKMGARPAMRLES